MTIKPAIARCGTRITNAPRRALLYRIAAHVADHESRVSLMGKSFFEWFSSFPTLFSVVM